MRNLFVSLTTIKETNREREREREKEGKKNDNNIFVYNFKLNIF